MRFKEVMIFRYRQTHRHFIIIFISPSSPSWWCDDDASPMIIIINLLPERIRQLDPCQSAPLRHRTRRIQPEFTNKFKMQRFLIFLYFLILNLTWNSQTSSKCYVFFIFLIPNALLNLETLSSQKSAANLANTYFLVTNWHFRFLDWTQARSLFILVSK